jgi:hypothetical protein
VQTINDTWHSLVFSHTNPTGAADLSQVKAIILQIAPKTSASDIYIDSVVAWKRLLTPRGAVTFTFDDGFQSIHNLVKPAMDVYGYRGVQSYIIGRLTDEDIALAKNLQQTGWDIVNHSYNHDFDQVYREPEFEYGLSQKWLAENGFEGGSQFTLVFGPNPTPKMYKFISENYILARGNKVGFNALPYLPALTYSHYVTNTRTVAAVKAYIDKAVEKGVWINIMFHNIKTSAPLSEYDWLISDLAEVLAYCNSTGIEVLTYSQIADRIRNSKTITLFGSGTITNGTTSVNIRHGFHKAPSSIQVTPTSSLGSAASLWVSSKDTGTGNLFTVSCNTNPGQDITFDWIATL